MFTGEKIGVGMGKTRKDAQQQAAENALRNLAGKDIIRYIIATSDLFQFLACLFIDYVLDTKSIN